MNRTDELRTARIDSLVTPTELAQRYPVSSSVASHVTDSRRRIEKILNGEDPRLLVVIGPCSIHDLNAAMEYATQLQAQRQKHQARLEIVMRTYFEKPRTVVGWKGLISDPDLNGSYRVNYGLELARRLLLQVNELGVPTATEFLDMVTGQFIADLISWGAIGARTTESQIHREMASALSCPVGFKNGTDGNTRIAVDAIRASRASHMFLSPDKDGQMTIYQTSGNPYGHIIMRGGKKPNYH
ncbi:3-deoxy-7-phosphoheptulonate synthase AroH, partial [Salmonella enterica subsp. enterica serovar Typhimurium]|nr:3-deoxy-7-phosphoheptulonate synthase AroH [Salmonella enterica subsp. enterica serovar Typhimurium]